MRGQKGITLVALVITIVVLLILAVVAINAITDSGLVEQANNAVNAYQNKVTEENSTLNGYATHLDPYITNARS